MYISSAVGSLLPSAICMPDSISVGSSGAVMGLFEAKLAKVACRVCETTSTRQAQVGHKVQMKQLTAVKYAVSIVAIFSFVPYVYWAAHLGGFLAIQDCCWMLLWFATGIVCTTYGFGAGTHYRYTNVQAIEDLQGVCVYCKCNRHLNNNNNNNNI